MGKRGGPAAPSLCSLSPKHDIRYTLRGLGLRLFDDVGIDVGGGARLGMTKLSGNGYKAGPGGDQDGGHAVPEAVRVDMRKPRRLENLFSHAVMLVGFMGRPSSWVNRYPVSCQRSPLARRSAAWDALYFLSSVTVSAGILTKRTFPVFVVVS